MLDVEKIYRTRDGERTGIVVKKSGSVEYPFVCSTAGHILKGSTFTTDGFYMGRNMPDGWDLVPEDDAAAEPPNSAEAFGYGTTDSLGKTPPTNLIGAHLTHSGNGEAYVITGFAWLGESDRWGFEHKRLDGSGPHLCRPLEHLNGKRADGSPRYSFG